MVNGYNLYRKVNGSYFVIPRDKYILTEENGLHFIKQIAYGDIIPDWFLADEEEELYLATRNTNGEFKNFLGIASGSSNELMTQLMLSSRLGLVEESRVTPIIHQLKEVQKINYSFIKKFNK